MNPSFVSSFNPAIYNRFLKFHYRRLSDKYPEVRPRNSVTPATFSSLRKMDSLYHHQKCESS